MASRFTRLLRNTYEWLNLHWRFSAFLSTIPGLWFIFIELLAQNIVLFRDEDGKLTQFGISLSIAIFVVFAVYSFLKAFGDNYIVYTRLEGQKVLGTLFQALSVNVIRKYGEYQDYIERATRKRRNPLRRVEKPQSQITNLAFSIQSSFSRLFDIPEDQISVSIAIKSPGTGHWEWFRRINADNDSSLEELLANPTSSFFQIVNHIKSYVFYPRKVDGENAREYFPSPLDQQYDLIGSIICRDVSVESRNRCLEGVLSVSTYGVEICDPDDEETIQKINTLVLPGFENLLRLELAIHYINTTLTGRKDVTAG